MTLPSGSAPFLFLFFLLTGTFLGTRPSFNWGPCLSTEGLSHPYFTSSLQGNYEEEEDVTGVNFISQLIIVLLGDGRHFEDQVSVEGN